MVSGKSYTRDLSGDVVLRSQEGAWVVVHCNEEVARMLYYNDSGNCDYAMGGMSYQIFISLGTLMLMVGIVTMSNASWILQVVLGATYLALNGIYMICALVPAFSRFWHWDLSPFVIEVVARSEHRTYTESLWGAIQATGETRWVDRVDLVPKTNEWQIWLNEAQKNITNPNWDAVAVKDSLIRGTWKENSQPQVGTPETPKTV